MKANENKIQKRFFVFLLLSLATLLSYAPFSWAEATEKPLPVEQAFVFSVTVDNPQTITAHWQIAKGYYLYRDRFRFNVMPGEIKEIQFPGGVIKQSIERGRYEVYAGKLAIPVHLQSAVSEPVLSVNYQGCSEGGFCYPPMTKTIKVKLDPSALSASEAAPPPIKLKSLLTDQESIRSVLHTQSLSVMLLIFLGVGILLAFTPCVLPMVPILTVIIAGAHASTKKAFFLSLVYVLGMALTYALAGLAAAMFGSSIQVSLQKPVFIILGSIVFILLALALFGLYEFRISHHWQNRITRWTNRHQGGTYVGVFCMGVLSTLIVSPCVTAPLVGVLIYIGQTGDLLLGAATLFMMGIGMGIPLLMVGMSAGSWLPKSGSWMEAIKKGFGILMIAMAVWMLSRIISPQVAQLLWGVLMLGIAIFLMIFVPRLIGGHLLVRAAGLTIAVLAVGIMLGVPQLVNKPQNNPLQQSAFIVVNNLQELKKQLDMARSAHQPVIVDFYADWCEACVSMDKHVFSKTEIQHAINGFVRLRADLTANDAGDEALMKAYNVIAPPTLLFFNDAGKEIPSKRIVGEVDANELLSRINVFFASGCDKKSQC